MSSDLINRTIYRALLRATANGKRPEVLGFFGSLHAYINSGISSLPAHPTTPSTVRDHLQFSFRSSVPSTAEDANDSHELFDGFAALRCANEHTKVMYPLLDPSWSLGIFDFSATALLPNEDAPFNFFEPRYKAMAMDAIENHNGWFILRGAVPTQFDDGLESASVLCRIHEHVETPEGNNIFVKVMAGPRVQVMEEMEEMEEAMMDQRSNSLPLARASAFEMVQDTFDAFDTTENIQELMHDVMQQLVAITVLSESLKRKEQMKDGNARGDQGSDQALEMDSSLAEFWERRAIQKITQNGLPPLDPEKFSFWALTLCLGQKTRPEGVQQRLSWLACTSTAYRLRHCISVLEKQQSNTMAQAMYLHGKK